MGSLVRWVWLSEQEEVPMVVGSRSSLAVEEWLMVVGLVEVVVVVVGHGAVGSPESVVVGELEEDEPIPQVVEP